MSVFFAPGVPDRALAATMTVFENPVCTLPRHQPGLPGVAASMYELEWAVDGRKEMTIAYNLANMADCMGIAASEFPGQRPDLVAVDLAFDELKDALADEDEQSVREILASMLIQMGQKPRRVNPMPARTCDRAPARVPVG